MGQTYFSADSSDVNIIAELHLDGKVYELERFSTELRQTISDKNMEPKGEVGGGTLTLTMVQVPDNGLLAWAASKYIRKSGEIVFKNETTTPPLRIQFQEAACINFLQNCGVGAGSYISLTISPKIVNFNDISLEHTWEE